MNRTVLIGAIGVAGALGASAAGATLGAAVAIGFLLVLMISAAISRSRESWFWAPRTWIAVSSGLFVLAMVRVGLWAVGGSSNHLGDAALALAMSALAGVMAWAARDLLHRDPNA